MNQPGASDPVRDVFVARQPILDTTGHTWGYELLHRSRSAGIQAPISGDLATMNVINASLAVIGLDVLAADGPVFINFTENMLVDGSAYALPGDRVVVEILEDVPPTERVLAACRELRRAGYTLALDDFCFDESRRPLLDLVSIVKVDFRLTEPGQRARSAERHGRSGPAYLMEKVETEAEHREARDLGYSLFQGFFFCKPTVMSGRTIPSSKLVRMQLLRALSRPGIGPEELRDVLKLDPSLLVGLLRYVNSAAVGVRRQITTLWDALMLLGAERVRRWLTIAILADFGSEHPPELLRVMTLRARFCELLSPTIGLGGQGDELFLLGLFSLVDTLLGCPTESVVEDLPLTEAVRSALRGEPGRLRGVLEMATAYERADWPAVSHHAQAFGLADSTLIHAYRDALEFSGEVEKAAA